MVRISSDGITLVRASGLNENIERVQSEVEKLQNQTDVKDQLKSQVSEIKELLDQTKKQSEELKAPVVLPSMEDMTVTLVPSHLLERLEEYRSDDSIAFLLVGVFGGAILAILVNWMTNAEFNVTSASGVLLGLLVFLEMASIFWTHRIRKRATIVRERMLRHSSGMKKFDNLPGSVDGLQTKQPANNANQADAKSGVGY